MGLGQVHQRSTRVQLDPEALEVEAWLAKHARRAVDNKGQWSDAAEAKQRRRWLG